MVRHCVAAVLLLTATATLAQPSASAPWPGLLGFSVNDEIDAARLRAAGFVEVRDGPLEYWRLNRANAFFARIDVTPMPGNRIGMIAASAPFARPPGVADSPEARAEMMARCQPARAALVEAMFAGYFQRPNTTSTYIAERVEAGAETAAMGARNGQVSCLLDPVTGSVTLALRLGRSDF